MKVFSLVLLSWLCASWAIYAQEVLDLTYSESAADFPNPERGFYRARELTDPEDFDIRGENLTLIYGRISADAFRDQPFSKAFLQQIQDGFDLARKHGIKVNPRVAYNYGPHPGKRARYGDDAPKAVILNHIQQLKPLWQENWDVINVLDAGFIGGWGEWHNSANGLDNPRDRKEILFAILDALPNNRMVVQRYPRFKREIFGGSETSTKAILTRERAFDGSHLARVGHLNDCFLSSSDDVGTYQNLDDGWPLKRELEYLASESPFVPFGGETCGMHGRSRCQQAVEEMELLHVNYLNHDYKRQVIERWQQTGCYDEIRRRLGYRFVLRSARLPQQITPGNQLELQLTIANVGFGELFNPRPIELLLTHNESDKQTVLPIAEDPRFWMAGQEANLKASLLVPQELPGGVYTVALRLPDESDALKSDARYSIRFANKDVWDAASGSNVLTRTLRVTE